MGPSHRCRGGQQVRQVYSVKSSHFPPTTLSIWIFGACRLPPAMGFQGPEAGGAAKHLPTYKTAPGKGLFGQDGTSTKIPRNPLVTRSSSHSGPSPLSTHCARLFLRFSCVFTFFEIIKPKQTMCIFPFIFNIKIATQKFTNSGKFLKNCAPIRQMSLHNVIIQCIQCHSTM